MKLGINQNLARKIETQIIQKMENFAKDVPTRFDDITNEIHQERLEKYYRQNVSKPTMETFTLAEKIGNILDKIA